MKEVFDLIGQTEDELVPVKRLAKYIRWATQKSTVFASSQIDYLILLLRSDEALRKKVSTYLKDILQEKDFVDAFCELGILPSATFLSELYRRIIHKIIPELYNEGDVRTFIARVFSRPGDLKWVRHISLDQWNSLLDLIVDEEWNIQGLQEQVGNALVVLSHRITALGLEPEVVTKLPEIDKLSSPFITQSEELIRFAQKVQEKDFRIGENDTDYRHIQVLLNQCEDILAELRDHKNDFGASISLTYLLVRMDQQIQRVRLLLKLFLDDKVIARQAMLRLMYEMVRGDKLKNSVFGYINQNIDLIAYQVTEHGSKTGEHYITKTRNQFNRLFKSSAQGGFIVGFMALFKMIIYYLKMAPFGHAFAYSMNYAAGFITMHVTHSALATKQPALTAQSIALSVQHNLNKEKDLTGIGEMVARVCRSQLISFAGNLAVVFPMGIIVAFVYLLVTGHDLADPDKALHLITENHPFRSGALIFASIAGVYLFLTGIVSGYVDNLVIYRNIPERIRKHRRFKKIMPARWMNSFSNYIEHNFGAITGNLFFGICMGSTAIIGSFFGIGADVRHITFATANFGIALVGLRFDVSIYHIFWTLVGIAGIGFFNFFVSFNLAFYVALKSRNIEVKDTFKVIGSIVKYAFTNFSEFFMPPEEPVAVTVPVATETTPEVEESSVTDTEAKS